MGRKSAFFLAIALTAFGKPALACSPPSGEWISSTLLSPVQGTDVPAGAAQLKIKVPTNFGDTLGRITLDVLEVVDGEFPAKSIRLNVSNVDHCNSYFSDVSTGRDAYITVLPLKYADGEHVKDKGGLREYGGLFYQGTSLNALLEKHDPKIVEYSQYQSFDFYDQEQAYCIQQGISTGISSDAAWRRCVEPGESVSLDCVDNKAGALVCTESDWPEGRPPDLRRGYSLWNDWGTPFTVGLLVVLTVFCVAGFAWKTKTKEG